MTLTQTWTVAMGVALAFVVGYAGAVFSTASKVAERKDPFHVLQRRTGNQLPPARFIAPGEKPVADDSWRKGKVVLVMVTTSCDACLLEARFLRGVVGKRNDVKFLGVLSFEQDAEALQKAQALFPFPVVRDDGMALMQGLGVTGVPIKIYLENGVVKRTWGGASMTEQARAGFTQWLTNLT
ncbi:MAG TPA: hypothetical protein VF883_12255 [Thermoanaerobaculia bacterium]|jgi:thiol-disulfide isomerase/thioredoxin